ncbi:MAG: hypothetical protein IPL46_32725 [Saprospiraceae bacterium]|nr:hypothetical protein [Saprospiraceae bacterium]
MNLATDIYPNPARVFVYFRLDDYQSAQTHTNIIDVVGRSHLSAFTNDQELVQISTSKLLSDYYLVTFDGVPHPTPLVILQELESIFLSDV